MLRGVLLATPLLTLLADAPAAWPAPELPARIRRIVLHTLGGPSYGRPEMRWKFLTPSETFARWRRARFGAHWIVWIDGSLWPRHPPAGEPASAMPPVQAPADTGWRRRLAREAAPVYSHVEGANGHSVGIELAHSGKAEDALPAAQLATLAWLVRTLLEMSQGRLGPGDVVGHKDLDPRPAYVNERCPSGHCPAYADEAGRFYRRRVDPPEELFVALSSAGLALPRTGRVSDEDLLHAEAIPENTVPRTLRP